MQHSDDVLGKEKMWKLIGMMTIPCILAQLVNLAYNLVDRIYIGNMDIIGKDALAGLGLCTPIIILITAFSGFVSGGGAPLASRALGAGDRQKAEKILGNGVFMLLFFTIILSILAFIFKKPLLYLIGASDITYQYANDYLTIYLIGTLFVQISMGLNIFITAQGKSRMAMLSTIVGAVLNIALDPLFIFGFNMGIKGAALATIIAQGASAIFIVCILMNKKASLRLRIKEIKPDFSIIGSIMALGVAQFVMTATESIIGFVLNGRLKYYGGDIHVSNLAVLQSVMLLITVPMTGFTQGILPILSYNFGAKDIYRLKNCFIKSVICTFSYSAIFALIMIIAPYPFIRIFTKDPELIELGVKYLPIFVGGMLIFGIQRSCQTTFVSIGDAVISLIIAINRKIILLVPLAFILPLSMGVNGVYYAELFADLTSVVVCSTVFIFRFKRVLGRMSNKEEQNDFIQGN